MKDTIRMLGWGWVFAVAAIFALAGMAGYDNRITERDAHRTKVDILAEFLVKKDCNRIETKYHILNLKGSVENSFVSEDGFLCDDGIVYWFKYSN